MAKKKTKALIILPDGERLWVSGVERKKLSALVKKSNSQLPKDEEALRSYIEELKTNQ